MVKAFPFEVPAEWKDLPQLKVRLPVCCPGVCCGLLRNHAFQVWVLIGPDAPGWRQQTWRSGSLSSSCRAAALPCMLCMP